MDLERRKQIYERIKQTKLNKLTIKQGDANVTLNLKKDLLDPSVSIPDKVLCMLEAYPIGATTSSTEAKPIKAVEPAPPPPQTAETATIKSSLSNTPTNGSPTKRVRFDLKETVDRLTLVNQINSLNEPAEPQEHAETAQSELNDTVTPKSSIIMSKNANKEPDTVGQEVTNKKQTPDDKSNKCRLCKMKCANEKALYEHVSRLHGGKGVFNQLPNQKYKDQEGGSYEPDYDDYAEDESDSDDEAYLSSNSDMSTSKKSKPSKNIGKSLPRPNVAIRVAKAAYYNSKDNTANLFKSNIFTNGGIRGNFFSQERLPLRSCKIKMKLSGSNATAEAYDSFLTNKVEINEPNYVDVNTTNLVQSLKTNNFDLLLTDAEIKAFFKSLLSYIPISLSNVVRLEDLIKENETYLTDLSKKFGLDAVEYFRFVHKTINDGAQFGVTLSTLKIKIKDKFGLDKASMVLIKELVDLLIENYLVLAVGVVERVLVSFEFKQHWVIESYKNQKGVGGSYSEEESVDISKEESNEEESDGEDESGRTKRRSNNKKAKTETAITNTNKNFKKVCLIPRPWRYIDGLLNRPVLKQMLETILLYLKSYPSSTFSSISSHFSPVLQPIMTLELLEMLERLKCVRKLTFRKEKECDLFSDFNNGSAKVSNEDELDGDEICCYCCTQNSVFTIKKVFPN